MTGNGPIPLYIGALVAASLGGAFYLRNLRDAEGIGFHRSLTPEQIKAARVIVKEGRQAGESEAMIAAMIVNAYAESGLDPAAVAGFRPWTGAHHTPRPGGEDSVGLFQLNARGGGRGMTLAERKDPALNTRRILSELNAARDGWRGSTPTLRTLERQNASIADLAGVFARDVERPADQHGERLRRAAMAQDLFGEAALWPGSTVLLVI